METDDEQVEKLKKWWEENGRSVIAGVVIGVGGLFGYRSWIDFQESQAEAASAHFVQVVEALESSKRPVVVEQAEILISDYSDSEYATLARFALARSFIEIGDFEQARDQLQQIVGSVGDAPLGFLARKRLASVQLQLAQPDQALITLATDFPQAFNAGSE